METRSRPPKEALLPTPEPAVPTYEPPRLEEHGLWTHITGISVPIGGSGPGASLTGPLDELDRLLGY